MKILKKITSLTMSAIFLFTTNSALQAAQVDTAQMAEIKELRTDIAKDLTKYPEVKDGKLYPDLPEPKEMMDRNNQTKINVKENLAKMKEVLKEKYQISEEQEKEAEGLAKYYIKKSTNGVKLSMYSIVEDVKYKYLDEKTKEFIKQLEQKIEKEANTKRYKKVISDRDERKRVAANTMLFANYDEWEDFLAILSLGTLIIGLVIFYSNVMGETALESALATWGSDLILLSVVLLIAVFIMELFLGAYTPVISHSFDDEEVFRMFSEKPFEYLNKFENIAEYINIHRRNHESARMLNDAVDIEYYLSISPNSIQNAKEKLYVGTIDWYEMEPEARAEYLHNFAERLRTEAKAKGQEYSNTHSFRKGLAEK